MFQYDISRIKAAARNRWKPILLSAGIQEKFLTGKPGPCPFCRDGHNRWVWDNKQGLGSGFCRRCSAKGDGFQMLACALGLNTRSDFPKLLEYVAQHVGISPRGARK